MNLCPHDLSERESAAADGMCPVCLAKEVAGLQARIVFLGIEVARLRRALDEEKS